MEKINLNIKLGQINKSLIEDRTYKNKEGKEITEQILKLELVPLKEKKFVAKGDNWELFKTHFIAHPSKQDEETTFVGDGLMFEREENDVNQKFNEITKEESPF